MATTVDHLTSSADQPLILRRRPDLIARRHVYQRSAYWVVKEPVGLQYFRFHEEEYAILEMLDGTVSLEDIRRRFAERFAPQRISLDELGRFLGVLYRGGLVLSDAPRQGIQLKQQREQHRRQARLAALTNVLAIRFRGVDPERALNALYPWCRWFFSKTAVICCAVLGLVALSVVVIHFDRFHARLPAFEEFFGPRNWLWLAATMAATKVLHELGHALACKHFGGECHEIGPMLLVLTPCLYCNVSDSWMLPSKSRRAAIAAAGIYVELVLASAATLIWWFSEPGMLNHLALRVMFICSLSTILFNGNPLLRFDGYYILADLVEIPNLRQKSTQLLHRFLAQKCLGLDMPEAVFLPQRNRVFFLAYAIAAIVYRWVVVLSILWFLNKVFEPYGLQVIGRFIALFAVGGLAVVPLWRLGEFLNVPGRMRQVKRKNLSLTSAAVVAVAAVVMCIPFPRRIEAPLEIRPRNAAGLFVEVPGRLESVQVKARQRVQRGESLARLSNIDLQLEALELAMRREDYRSRLLDLQRQRFDNPDAGETIPEIEEMIRSIDEQLAERRRELAHLSLVAPIDGMVFAAPLRNADVHDDSRLPEWSGSLLSGKNLGALVAPGTLLCEIGNPAELEATLVIDQSNIELVATGQRVAIKLDAYPARTLQGEIEEVSQAELRVAPRSLSHQAGGALATRTDEAGVQHPLHTSYTARVPLGNHGADLQLGLRGRAQIYTGYQTLAGRLWRTLCHTFHFQF